MQDLSGRKLGPYTIKKKLGQGGMGSVYLAHQTTMDRDVAIKVLPIVLAQDTSYLERFRREAKMIANLEHARILPVHDYGEQDGISYIVMRYLKAGTLAERIRSGKIPLPEIIHIMLHVAQGLDYAHAKGIIHRDVKPANIMLDHNGDVYVTDFGLSKLVEDSSHLTGSAIMGTPEYIAPEQGMDGEVDHRSDIYSLGVVLYEMLTGKVPFTGKSGMVVIVKHINETFPDPIKAAPDIPPAVANVVLKATAKEPNERYQSCRELVDALSEAAAGAVRARPRTRPLPSSPRWLVPALVGAIVVLVIALVAPLISPLAATPAPILTVTLEPTADVSVPTRVPNQPPSEQTLPIDDGLIVCPPDTETMVAYNFRSDRPDGARVFVGDTSAIRITSETITIDPEDLPPPGIAVPIRLDQPLHNVDVLVSFKWPAGRGALQIFVRVDTDSEDRYGAGTDPRDNAIKLWKGTDVLESDSLPLAIFDGQFHEFRFSVIEGTLTFTIDGGPALVAYDDPPFLGGQILFIVGGAPVELDMIAVCGSS